MKQFGLFGDETKQVEAKNEKLAQEVLPDDAFATIYAAVVARENPYDATVKTRAQTLVTIRQCDEAQMTGRKPVSDLVAQAQEQVRVELALEAGEDPYADDYHVAAHEVYDAIYYCLQHDEDPEELEFTCYHPEVPNSERTIKLSQCVYIGAEDKTWAQLVSEVKDEVEQFAGYVKEHADIMEEDLL